MKDINGIELEPGQTIERVIDDGTKFVGRQYEVILWNFKDNTQDGKDLCAKSFEQILLLTPENSKQFQIV